jgi:hypothetical protein
MRIFDKWAYGTQSKPVSNLSHRASLRCDVILNTHYLVHWNRSRPFDSRTDFKSFQLFILMTEMNVNELPTHSNAYLIVPLLKQVRQ